MVVPALSRRRALSGVATVGVSLPLLSACGDDEGGSTSGDKTSPSMLSATSILAAPPEESSTDTINCPGHQSTYDLATGEPTGGPAPSALDPVALEVSENQVVPT